MDTVGLLVLVAQAQEALAQVSTDTAGRSFDLVELLAHSSAVSRAVLVILLLFSITSWGVILFKLWAFRRAERHTAGFLDVFRKSTKFSEVQAVCRTFAESPIVGIFQTGYAELNSQLRQPPAKAGGFEGVGSNPGHPLGVQSRPMLKSLSAVDRALLRAAAVEVSKLERRLPFLATTASITPFIGLFGTVWGVMAAFANIGAVGSTSLAVVAPGIAEALIATAAGLFAAIPAVYFYNAFTSRVKEFATEMDDFSLEFLNISEKNFT